MTDEAAVGALAGALDAALESASFRIDDWEYDLDDYLRAYEFAGREPARPQQFSSPRSYERPAVDLPAPLRQRLDVALAQVMASHMDDRGMVGIGVPLIIGGNLPPDIGGFRCRVVTSAALFGAQRTAESLRHWVAGGPAHCASMTVLRGVSVEEPLELYDGVRLVRLPSKVEDLTEVVPKIFIDMFCGAPMMEGLQLPGMTVLCCEWAIRSVFCPPDKDGLPTRKPDAAPALPEENSPLLWLAFSLACDTSALPTHHWMRASDGCTRVILGIGQDGPWGRWSHDGSPSAEGPSTLTKERADRALRLVGQLGRRGDKLHVPVDRWARSKRSATAADQLIDLRIALESLYARGSNTEAALRVAVHGAWHLGASPDERLRYFRLLRDVYRRASRVAHGRALSPGQDDRSFLSDAKAACRRGILKILDEGEPDDWEALIMGASGSAEARVGEP